MSGFLEAFRAIFGTYQPIQYINYVVGADGNPVAVNVVPAGLAGVNMEYVGQVLLFCICLYCLFKLIGSVLSSIAK